MSALGSKPSRLGGMSGSSSEDWIPYSDLMAGLLALFALLLVTSVFELKEDQREIREILESRQQLIADLKEMFSGSVNVTIDDEGRLRLEESVLFLEGEAELGDRGEQILTEAMPKYIEAVFANERVRKELDAIHVVGHTNSRGESRNQPEEERYLYNLGLSQARAASVVEHVRTIPLLVDDRADLTRYLKASGRSFADRIMTRNPDGTEVEDFDRSRRIEIFFSLKDGDMVQRLLQKLQG